MKPRAANAAPTRPADGGGHTIRVVAARTGLEMGTLRAWERRYGFPRPERRAGSNRRLYSNADVDRLVAIQRTLEHGYRVGDVIDKSIGELDELARGQDAAPRPVSLDFAPTPEAELIELLANDRVTELEAQLRRSAAALGPRRFVTELAHPLAVSVGQAWAEGRLSIRHEHLATECLVTQIRQLLATYQDIHASPLVLLATFPGELHTLPLELIALYLVVTGAKPRLLGGPTPAREIAESARTLRADAVGIAVTFSEDRKQTRAHVKTLRSALEPHVPLWIGGAGAVELDLGHENTRVLTSWDAIERAVVDWRERPRRKPSSRSGV